MVTSMFDSLVWSFSQPELSLVNSMPKVSAPQLTLVCACVILPWLSQSTAWFWKISSALVFIVVFWSMSAGASSSAHGWWVRYLRSRSVVVACAFPCHAARLCNVGVVARPAFFVRGLAQHVFSLMCLPRCWLAMRCCLSRGIVVPTFPRVGTFCTLEWRVLCFT